MTGRRANEVLAALVGESYQECHDYLVILNGACPAAGCLNEQFSMLLG
jgi:hypothetical protein